jgi:hypothetical protein
MNDVARLILETWEKLRPKIVSDPSELARRLARRRLAILTRPVRAWCVAVRASDRRITPAHWVISPEHAMDLDHPEHPYEPIEHEVIIRPHALRKFCRAVRTDSWGEEVEDVCKMLGVSKGVLMSARCAGLYTERYVKGLGGKRGKPIPLIHSWKTLDPSGYPYNSKPDALWGSLWEFLPDMVPDDFEQTLVRRPRFGRFSRWKTDDLQHLGWFWVCPGCKKERRTVFYPLPPSGLFDHLGYDPGRGKAQRSVVFGRELEHYDVEDVSVPPPTFACRKCHGITSFTHTSNHGWNLVVSHLTRGLLYGREVPKPEWYKRERKKARHRALGKEAPRREAVMERVEKGWPDRKIARDLMMSLENVQRRIWSFCKQEGVGDREELGRKLGWEQEQPLNQRDRARRRRAVVEELLREGLTYREISKRTGIAGCLVAYDGGVMFRKHGLGGKRGRKEFRRMCEGKGQKSEVRSQRSEVN